LKLKTLGISGLVSAFYARKQFPYSEITVFEKSEKVGGWMDTKIIEKFVHEMGPRSIRNNKMAVEILNICDELNILDRVIKDNPKAMKIRIISDENLATSELKKWKLVVKFLTIKLKYHLSPKIKQNVKENDLTVTEFFEQFVGKDSKFVNGAIDPFLSGIWAGKISELSVKSTLHVMLTFLKDPR
jgi:protoporphyrinogen/coproporphyrinogen III oxidase